MVPQRPSVGTAQAGADWVRPGGGHQDHRGRGQQEQGQDSVNLGEYVIYGTVSLTLSWKPFCYFQASLMLQAAFYAEGKWVYKTQQLASSKRNMQIAK